MFLQLRIIIIVNIKYLLHVTREFYFVKVICRNLYALFSNVRKAYTINQKGLQLFSQVEGLPIKDSVSAFEQSEPLNVCIHIAFLYSCASKLLFRKRRDEEKLYQVRVGSRLVNLLVGRVCTASRHVLDLLLIYLKN